MNGNAGVNTIMQQLECTEDTLKPENEILPGFPEKIEGPILFMDSDDINTDGIFAGSLTYQDNLTTSEVADACFKNYDPSFNSIARPGSIIVTGYNFGCGSSQYTHSRCDPAARASHRSPGHLSIVR